jgi:hypothetical protein
MHFTLHIELQNISLFVRCIAKVLLMTGLGPAMVWAALHGSGTRFFVSTPLAIAKRLISSPSSGSGQLADRRSVLFQQGKTLATSPAPITQRRSA